MDLVKCDFGSVSLPDSPEAQTVTFTDERRGVRISVVPAAGGEIGSFQVRDGARWREILYRAMRYDAAGADGWTGRAPTLWPAAGRSFTERQLAAWRRTGKPPACCAYVANGRERRIPGHGFARNFPWALESYGYGRDDAWVTCALRSGPATRRFYPFDFEAFVTYTLDRGTLAMRYEFAAARGNRGAMPMAVGNHISFKLPFFGRGRYGDCSLRSTARTIYEQTPLCLLSGATEPSELARGKSVGLKKYQDTAFGDIPAGEARMELIDPRALTITVTQREVPTGRRKLPQRNMFFVVWGSPKLRYFCPEPWAGRPNALNVPADGISLRPGERFVWEARFGIKRSNSE